MLPAFIVEEASKPSAGCCRQRRCSDKSFSVIEDCRNEQDSNTRIICNHAASNNLSKQEQQIRWLADRGNNQTRIDNSKGKPMVEIMTNENNDNNKYKSTAMQQISIISNHHERLQSCPDGAKERAEETSEMQHEMQAQDDDLSLLACLRNTLLRHSLLRPHLTRTKQLKQESAGCSDDCHKMSQPKFRVGGKHKTIENSTKKSKSKSSSSSSHQVAISSLPSVIVCVSLALLVLVSRTSAINKPTQSLQQLAKSADVELKRSLQRSQRDAVAPLVIGSNSTITAVAGLGPTPTCGYPGSPAHASVIFNTSHVVAGTAASYTCDNGYELLGPPRRICQANGTWAPIGIPFCVLNVGLGKAAMQSSTVGQGSAQKAVDGSTSPYFQASTCTMTDVENNPWWYVNLLEPYLVQIVRIDFGTACCANRQKATVAVRVGNNRPDLGTNPLCNRYHGFIEEGKPLFLPCTRPAPGAFVSIHLESPSGSALSICETFIYTDHALSIEQCPSFRDQPLGSTATYNGKCYLFHNNQLLNFDSARKYCESRGGTLVDETSPALQGFLSWELYRRHRNDQLMGQYWLGAVRDTRNSQNWKWINGRDVQISFWNSLANQGNCSRFDGSKGWLWSDTDCQSQLNFICQYRPLSCGKPEKPTNSTLITKNIDNGTVIEYQCAPGNLLMGPKSRVCLPTGFFSEFAPKCKYLDCQYPAMIANGDYKLLNGTTAYQSVVTYFCNDGYQLYGRPTLTCDVDERWNGPPPRCEPLLCPAPVAPSNGYVTVTSNITTPGTQATYDCRPGYELVGERLLSCMQSGSWDQSFPYCREKAHLSSPQLTSAAVSGQQPAAKPAMPTQNGNAPKPTNQNAGSRQQQSVQFPPSASATSFSSNRVVPTSQTVSTVSPSSLFQPSSSSPTTAVSVASSMPLSSPTGPTSSAAIQSPASINSLPASLNGLAGQQQPSGAASNSNNNQQQQQQQQPPVSLNEISSSSAGGLPSGSNQHGAIEHHQNSRKPAQPSSISSFVQPPPPPPPPPAQTPQVVNVADPIDNNQRGSTRQQPQAPPMRTPMSPGNNQRQNPTSASGNSNSNNNNNNNNRFTFNPIQSTSTHTIDNGNGVPQMSTTSGHFDSSPLATTNSISVHHNSQQQQPSSTTGQPQVVASDPTIGSSSTTTGATGGGLSSSSTTVGLQTTSPSHTQFGGHHHQHHHHHQQQQQQTNSGGLLGANNGGFSQPPMRASSHNSLANAKNSLDGIIAVAIFGGFIFLGAIITILVIIIRRRKSSRSSVIDAQTISTYDSNQEHNGLYRNYQQAWENLRFSAPNSQPKSSGNGPGGSGGVANSGGLGGRGSVANLAGPTSMALKSYASGNVAILHHAHPIHANGGAHHTMGLSSSSTTSSSSHTSSSVGNSGGDPLLGSRHNPHHFHQHSSHHHHAAAAAAAAAHQLMAVRHQHHQHDEELDDEEEEEEQGIVTEDEAPYNHQMQAMGGRLHQRRSHHYVPDGSSGGHLNEGFRDTNELTINADTATASSQAMSRSMATAAANRRSLNNLSSANNGGHAHHHHSHQTGNGGGQRQSTTSSSSAAQSSRASPDELDRLAYGNNWPSAANGSASQLMR